MSAAFTPPTAIFGMPCPGRKRPALETNLRLDGRGCHLSCAGNPATFINEPMKTAHSPVFTTAISLLAACHVSGEAVSLFNGENLDGWTQRGGGAEYKVEGDTIVGISKADTPNTFLCTTRDYSDFVLEYEFMVDARLNSGVQIRSNVYDEESSIEWDGRNVRIPAGRVHGYQVEIDPDTKRMRMWSAGVFDEARRGWLYPAAGNKEQEKAFSEQGNRIFKPGEWNRVRVEAIGDSIKTWLNGEPRAELKDPMNASGFIALQVHSIPDPSFEGTEVRWRNLKITEKSPAPNTLTDEEKAAGWRLLWDGATADGWRGARSENFPERGWEMKDGVLTVLSSGGAEGKGGGDIVTRERFSNIELQLEFKMSPAANSGIKYFTQTNLNPIDGSGAPAAIGSSIGLEYQILDDKRHPDAKQGTDGNRTLASLYDLITAAEDKVSAPIGGWNHARLLVKDDHVEHWLNGRLVVSYNRKSPETIGKIKASKYKLIKDFGQWPDGHILLQDHGDRVSFRNIKLRIP